MRFTKLLGLFVVALTTVLFATPILAQEGKTYEVQFSRSDNDTRPLFCGCMSFDEEAPGILRMEGFGMPLRWAHTDLNESNTGWQALSVPGLARVEVDVPEGVITARFAFHGSVKRRASLISGDAFSFFGTTAVFEGFENPECSRFTCEVN